jgi:hypothetical protein
MGSSVMKSRAIKLGIILLENIFLVFLVSNIFFTAGRTSLANDIALTVGTIPVQEYSGEQKRKILFLKGVFSDSSLILNGYDFVKKLENLLDSDTSPRENGSKKGSTLTYFESSNDTDPYRDSRVYSGLWIRCYRKP